MSPITVEEIENAKVEIIKILQRQVFPDDLSALTPNMILTGVTRENAQPDVFIKSDVSSMCWSECCAFVELKVREWGLKCGIAGFILLRDYPIGASSNCGIT